MRIFTLFIFLIGSCLGLAYGQKVQNPKDIVQKAKVTGEAFQEVNPFLLHADKNNYAAMIGPIHNYEILNIQVSQLQQLSKKAPGTLQLNIPFSDKNHLELELVKVNIFSSDFEVLEASTNLPAKVDPGSHYRGTVKGQANSFVAISILPREIMGLINVNGQNWVLGKLKNNVKGAHIIYQDQDIIRELGFECGTPDDGKAYSEAELSDPDQEKDLTDCVRFFFEVDYDIFLDKGGTNAASAYVSGLVNQVSTLYANENINTVISQIVVWDEPSPYTGGSSSNMLNQFQANTTNWNGDLAQLLSYQSSGGVAAGFNGICNNNRAASMSFSSISGSYNTVPTYSWSVMVVTHEFGHLFGSRHTHACVWNGNGTAIDGCADFTEGSCEIPGYPENGGTIMSYCHLQSVGINFNEGFGLQPGNVIRNVITNATCLFDCGPPSCSDGILNGNETGVDCGGPDCDPCPTCNDGIQNGDETGVDCGGPDCEPCPCFGNVLTLTIVLDNYPEETTWDVRNANGTIVANGGSYGAFPDGSTVVESICVEDGCFDFTIYDSYGDGICCGYGQGSYLLQDSNGTTLASGGAFSNSETTNFCVSGNSGPTCNDGVQNGNETGVDCGGPDCPACPTCDDGVQNGNETGVDCGGPDCPACPTCDDGVQNGNETGVDCGGPDCAACPTCFDGIQNGNETGVDCGGSNCLPCPTCDDGVQNGNETGVDCGGPDCAACPTCFDGIQNGDETGVDCGGPCPRCDDGPTCNDGVQNGDETGVDCGGSNCPACPTCDDGVQNGDETGVDCGGPDCPDCPMGCTDNSLTLTINLDDYPEETSWEITQNGLPVASGGPYTTESQVVETLCLPDGCYIITMIDAFGDGICCEWGEGSYELVDDADGAVLASGGAFAYYDNHYLALGNAECPSCDDGIQNGDETGIDCGGLFCEPCEGEPCVFVTENFEDFESGWGIWNDGGSDARRHMRDRSFAYSGDYCVRLRDNSSTSIIATDVLDLSGEDQIKVSFIFYARSMEAGEGFYLEISSDGGSSYEVIGEWREGAEFLNNQFYFDQVQLSGPFSENTRLRFRCDGASNSDYIYLDDIEISTCNGGGLIENNEDQARNEPGDRTDLLISDLADSPTTELMLFPNPVSDRLNISLSLMEAADATLFLTDMTGKVVHQQSITGETGKQRTELDVSGFGEGVYFLHLISKESKISRKFIIAR